MKHFRLRVILSVLLAAGFVVAFSWIVVGQNYSKLSGELSKEKPLTPAAPPDPEDQSAGVKRSVPGSIAFVPSAAGLILAGAVIRDLTGKKPQMGV